MNSGVLNCHILFLPVTFGQLPSESLESGRIPTECTTKTGAAVADDRNGGCGLHWRILKKINLINIYYQLNVVDMVCWINSHQKKSWCPFRNWSKPHFFIQQSHLNYRSDLAPSCCNFQNKCILGIKHPGIVHMYA